jgi:hypothetical protein
MKTKIIKLVIFSPLVSLLFSTYAMAYGVTLKSKYVSTVLSKGTTGYYQLELEYDTHIAGIPIPTNCQIGAEIPFAPLLRPQYLDGSFSSMEFEARTGSVTGTIVWQCYKKFQVTGKQSKYFDVSALAENNAANGDGYIGVGAGYTGYDYYFTTSTY